jgi:hypothetical protein
MKTLAELFEEDEIKRIEKQRAEQAKEDATWNALPQSEKDRIIAEREAYWEKFDTVTDEQEDEEHQEEDDDDEVTH